MAADTHVELDGVVFDAETMEILRRAHTLLQQGFGGENPSQLADKMDSLIKSGEYAEADALRERVDENLLEQAIAEARRAMDRVRWVVAGVDVPSQAEEAVRAAPERSWKAMIAGIEAGIRALADKHHKLGRILESAAARREEGQVFAEASREVRDRNYRERVEWYARKYREVRSKYGQGEKGDKAARLEVAVLYSRFVGKKPACDKTVCNLLEAATKIESPAHVETAG